jgi:hypothetical protein
MKKGIVVLQLLGNLQDHLPQAERVHIDMEIRQVREPAFQFLQSLNQKIKGLGFKFHRNPLLSFMAARIQTIPFENKPNPAYSRNSNMIFS